MKKKHFYFRLVGGNQYLYPRLSLLVKKYLSIPASSVPSERVFSIAGQVVSKKRSRMHPSNVDMFIFLNKKHGQILEVDSKFQMNFEQIC